MLHAPITPNPLTTRARLAAQTRWHPGEPETLAASTEHRATAAEAYIRKLVASSPPLTDAQRDRLASLLRRVA